MSQRAHIQSEFIEESTEDERSLCIRNATPAFLPSPLAPTLATTRIGSFSVNNRLQRPKHIRSTFSRYQMLQLPASKTNCLKPREYLNADQEVLLVPKTADLREPPINPTPEGPKAEATEQRNNGSCSSLYALLHNHPYNIPYRSRSNHKSRIATTMAAPNRGTVKVTSGETM